MGSIKESLELFTFIGKTANAGVEISADGEVQFQEVIGQFGIFLSAQGAVEGANKITLEVALADDSQVDEIVAAATDQLTAVKPEVKGNIGRVLGGILGGYRIIAGSTADAIADAQRKGNVPVTSMSEDGGLGVTGRALLEAAA